MSHASLIVITDAKPTQDELQEALLPYHEYECTGIERYTVEVDVTDEVLSDYEQRSDPAQSLVDYAEENYGAAARDGRYYRRTNPRAKWDYWTIGGRYSGRLAPGYDPQADPANQETCRLCGGTGRRTDMVVARGCNGCGGTGASVKFSSHWVDRGNQSRWGDVDLTSLMIVHRAEKALEWDAALAEYEKKRVDGIGLGKGYFDAEFGDALRAYEAVVAALRADMDAGRGTGALYQRIEADPRAARLRELVGHADSFDYSISGAYTREAHVATAVPLSCWAVLLRGEWIEKGSMGWFGVSSGDVPDWPAQLAAILAEISPDRWLTIIDYHI